MFGTKKFKDAKTKKFNDDKERKQFFAIRAYYKNKPKASVYTEKKNKPKK